MKKAQHHNQGAILILAMLFLMVFASMAVTMSQVVQTNLFSADTHEEAYHALASAESGLYFASQQANQLAKTVTTTKGDIDDDLAGDLWQQLAVKIRDQMGNAAHCEDDPAVEDVDGVIQSVTIGPIASGTQAGAPTFTVTFEAHPLAGENYNAALYQAAPFNVGGGENKFTADGEAVSSSNIIAPQWVRIRCVGQSQGVERAVQMEFKLDKKVRYAILSRNRIMIGRNVIIEGSIGSRYTLTDYQHGHPVQMRDNFHGLNATLDAALDSFVEKLATNDIDGDNRIQVSNELETTGIENPTQYDLNGDGYIDTMDLFFESYDTNDDGKVTDLEFSDNGQMIDEQLWQLINEVKYPLGTEFDWANQRVKLPGSEDWTDAEADMEQINIDDNYAKIHGEIVMKSSIEDWESGAANGDYQQFYRGGILPDPNEAATTFQVDDADLAQFSPDQFDVSSYKALATGSFADQTETPVANDDSQPTTFTPAGAGTLESVPYNSPYPYDYYTRPVYENMTFTNVTIPKGTNALFKNCKFVGVTFVDTEVNNDDPNFNYAGMLDANGQLKYAHVEAVVGEQTVSDTKPLGNNIRFDHCDFEGVVVSEAPNSFTHARNKLQFTGNTKFDIKAEGLSSDQKKLFAKSTILAPQYSIDMGTFSNPDDPGEVTRLEGAIVVGVLDIRGQARIEGSLITTFEPTPDEGPLAEGGNPASFNTTIGYFESSAGDSEAEIPEGGYGRILIRYDPDRPMPDGILGPIEITGNLQTYAEVQP